MTTELIVSYFFTGLCGLSVLAMLITKNIIYAAYALVAALISIAVLFIFLGVEFLAVVQILVYAGGILVLIIFGVMLTGKSSIAGVLSEVTNRVSGFIVSLLIFGLLAYIIINSQVDEFSWIRKASSEPSVNLTIKEIGKKLMTQYVLPFELAGFLLLVAMAGALVLAGMAIKKNIKNAA